MESVFNKFNICEDIRDMIARTIHNDYMINLKDEIINYDYNQALKEFEIERQEQFEAYDESDMSEKNRYEMENHLLFGENDFEINYDYY